MAICISQDKTSKLSLKSLKCQKMFKILIYWQISLKMKRQQTDEEVSEKEETKRVPEEKKGNIYQLMKN